MLYNLIEKSKPVDLSAYCLFNNYDRFKISNYYGIDKNKNCDILVINTTNEFAIHSKGKAMDNEVESNHVFGSFTLKDSCGNLYLRREKIEDKIADIFDRADIDFKENKQFSKKYHLVGNKENLIREKFSSDLLERISKIENLELEVVNNRCVFCISRLPKSKELENTTVEVCLQLERLFNS